MRKALVNKRRLASWVKMLRAWSGCAHLVVGRAAAASSDHFSRWRSWVRKVAAFPREQSSIHTLANVVNPAGLIA